MFDINLEDRIQQLDANLVVTSREKIVLTENNSEGQAELVCNVKNYTVAFLKLEDKKIQYFNHKNCADGILFEKLPTDQWIIHIIEFKRTVKAKEWFKIKKQFKGAILQATACMGILGIPNVSAIKCYTAFRYNQINETEVEDPVIAKQMLAGDNPFTLFDWMTDKIKLDLLNKDLEHAKIQLNVDTGFAEVFL